MNISKAAAALVLGVIAALECSTWRTNAQSTSTSCYPTIGTLNSAMRTEQIRIQNGGLARDGYQYILCTNTFFDAAIEPLQPLLDNAMFQCGDSGDVTNRCVFAGGTQQVVLLDSLLPGYFVGQVDFLGLTFSSFQSHDNRGTSIAAFASTTTTATFTNCIWQDFSSDFVVLQSAEKSFFGPMTVQIKGGKIVMGSAGVIFDNDGGLLRVDTVEISSVTAASMIATANNGASFLENSNIYSSNVNSVTYTTSGATQSILYSTVSRMNSVDDAFYVEDLGSSLLLDGVTLEKNNVQTMPWSAVSVRTGAITRINQSSIVDNSMMEFGVVVFDSKVWITDSVISRNSGTEGQTSTTAPVFAITDAEVNVERVEFNENTQFSGMVVALIRSVVNIKYSCFQGGAAEFLVFVSNDGNFDAANNYVSRFSSQRCQTTGPRVFLERTGSGCFLGSSQCEGACLELASESSCRAQQIPTVPPTTRPTRPVPRPVTWPPISPITPLTFAPQTSLPTRVPTTVPVTAAPSSRPTTSPVQAPMDAPSPRPTANPVRNPTTANPVSLKPTDRQPSMPIDPRTKLPSSGQPAAVPPQGTLQPMALPSQVTLQPAALPSQVTLQPAALPSQVTLQPVAFPSNATPHPALAPDVTSNPATQPEKGNTLSPAGLGPAVSVQPTTARPAASTVLPSLLPPPTPQAPSPPTRPVSPVTFRPATNAPTRRISTRPPARNNIPTREAPSVAPITSKPTSRPTTSSQPSQSFLPSSQPSIPSSKSTKMKKKGRKKKKTKESSGEGLNGKGKENPEGKGSSKSLSKGKPGGKEATNMGKALKRVMRAFHYAQNTTTDTTSHRIRRM